MLRRRKKVVMTMTDVTTQDRAKRGNGAKPKRDRERMVADDVVTPNSLATHLGCTRQNIARLTAEAVLVQRSDGNYDQTANRLRLFKHLRENHRHTARSKADAEHIAVKTKMLQSRLDEREGRLIAAEEATHRMMTLYGTFITGLSSFPAKIGGRDLGLRRAVDKAVFDLRTEIGTALHKLADADHENANGEIIE
jgi:hypothetical protein